MAQADAAGEFSELPERFTDGQRLVLSAGRTDLLDDPGKIGITQPFGLIPDRRSLFAEGIQCAHLLGILEMIHLFGESNHERVDLQFQIRVLITEGTDGFSSLLHDALIGHTLSQLNRISEKKGSLEGFGVEEGQAQDHSGGRFQSK